MKKKPHKNEKNHHDFLHLDLVPEVIEKSVKKAKKSLGLFYKFAIFALVICCLVLSYFLVLVSVEPKSFPFVTNKVQEKLQEEFGPTAKIKDSLISFTSYGAIKVELQDISFFQKSSIDSSQQKVFIANVQSEISLWKILLLNFVPKSVKIYSPSIVFVGENNGQNHSENEASATNANDFFNLIKTFTATKLDDFALENFEIQNANLLFNNNGVKNEVLIKKSQILSSFKGGVLFISSVNKIKFSKIESDVDFKANCQLQELQNMKCDLILENFAAASVSNLHPQLSWLNNINSSVNFLASGVVKNGKLKNVVFKAASKEGDFSFLEFFAQKIHFKDLDVIGEYDFDLDKLNLSQIKAKFPYAVSTPGEAQFVSSENASDFAMSLQIENVKDVSKQKFIYDIALKAVPTSKLEMLWPIGIVGQDIRTWVITHFKSGIISQAQAKFSLFTDSLGELSLEDINASLDLNAANLLYDEAFPEVKNISAEAKFSKKDMIVNVSSAQVLESKVNKAEVKIEDFDAEKIYLKIAANTSGNPADLLKHASNSKEFQAEVQKYLNGSSESEIAITLPLSEDITLKKTYISVNSKAENINGEVIKGAAQIKVKKDNSTDVFNAEIDLTKAELIPNIPHLAKKMNEQALLNVDIEVPNERVVNLKKILLQKYSNKKVKNISVQKVEKISGKAVIETKPFSLKTLEISNQNFGQNNYNLVYKSDVKQSQQKLSIKGSRFDLAEILENKIFTKSNNKKSAKKDLNFKATQVEIMTDNLNLLRGKNFKNFYFFIDCKSGFCSRLAARANYGNKNFLSLKTSKDDDSSDISLNGRITDLGYFAEAFGISNVISNGDTEILAKTKQSKEGQVIEGEINVKNSITIYESDAVKKLSRDSLFSSIKDKIFSSEKTTFDMAKAEFSLVGSNLDLKSFVANNFKVGVTAKGSINLSSDAYNLKGVIIPGFIINNLFGIEKIPLIGGVIRGLLTGGEEGGGVFGIKYEYVKNSEDKEGKFTTNKVSSFVPTTIKNLFDF